MKKVSVIIPCYNATKWLPKCFLTLVSQTIGMSELELIFVDDASTDDGATYAMLQEFERAYPEQILVIYLEKICVREAREILHCNMHRESILHLWMRMIL